MTTSDVTMKYDVFFLHPGEMDTPVGVSYDDDTDCYDGTYPSGWWRRDRATGAMVGPFGSVEEARSIAKAGTSYADERARVYPTSGDRAPLRVVGSFDPYRSCDVCVGRPATRRVSFGHCVTFLAFCDECATTAARGLVEPIIHA